MAYSHILKAVHRNLLTASQFLQQKQQLVQVGVLVHRERTMSTMSRLPLLRIEVPPPALSCLSQAQTRRGFSIHFTARNRISPEDRDKSVSTYQSGSPKLSASQKGTLNNSTEHDELEVNFSWTYYGKNKQTTLYIIWDPSISVSNVNKVLN